MIVVELTLLKKSHSYKYLIEESCELFNKLYLINVLIIYINMKLVNCTQ